MPAPDSYPFRLWTNYITTAANANMQLFTFVTNDDYRDRFIETIFVGLATSGIAIALYTTGQEYSIVDFTRFGLGDPVLDVDMLVKAKLSLTVGIQDLAGAAHTNIPVVIGYRVNPNDGP